jgi:hypothetical protein
LKASNKGFNVLDKSNVIVSGIESANGHTSTVAKVAHEAYTKMVDILRLTATKNAINRMSDYHYLNIPVSNSTEPIRGIDYIAPVVTPGVDYATAVITKCLMPNGKINFEFERFAEIDVAASMQSTEMVKYMLNSKNDSYQFVRDWAQDALLHKNGIVMLSPIREPIVQYKEVEGTRDQLRSFEIMAGDKGLTAKRQQMRKIDVNLEGAMASMMQPEEQEGEQEPQGEEMVEALNANTIYRARYKLTGYSTTMRVKPIAQHYWVCNPTIVRIQDQDFCGFYDPMTIHEAKIQYPSIDMEKFAEHAQYGPAGAPQSGAMQNDLAIHVRDSMPIAGTGTVSSQGVDKFGRVVLVTTAWMRSDIDNDGEEEIIEICYSGSYVLYAKEVDFIPLACMCPKPLTGNFYGYSLAERLVPAQEYKTGIQRAEMSFAMQASTPRVGVNPEFVDAEEMQRGVSALFILDRKFDATKHVYEFAPMQGNLAYVESAMQRFDSDRMNIVGMTSPNDTMNPEVMKDGNSGYKLQLAMGPNQLIQDEMVKNCAIGLRELIWLTWRTMILYKDDFNIQQLANAVATGQPFMDAASMDNYEFIDRKLIALDLALGFLSEENRLTRQQMITQCQTQFTQAMMQVDPSVPEMFGKLRRPYEDTLRILGVKDVDAYLPTMEEAQKMAQAMAAKPPSGDAKEQESKTNLNNANTEKSQAQAKLELRKIQDMDTDDQFEAIAASRGKLTSVQMD